VLKKREKVNMTDDLVKELRFWNGGYKSDEKMKRAAELIEALEGQIRIIQSASKHAMKSYQEHLAVYRQKLEEKPPIWYDDIQSLRERDSIMTDRIEKLEAALREIRAMHYKDGIDDLEERDDRTYCIVCDALEGKDG
jgi:DNA polymerase II small subunit/DNA polymerase delta subunit B